MPNAIVIFRRNNYAVLLTLIIIIGSFLRFYKLSAPNLTSWEVSSVAISSVTDLVHNLQANKHAPLYFLFFKLWSGLFGNSEFALRFPSVIFGILSIPLVYLIAKTLLNRKIGLLSSFIFSISIEQILYSKEARLYSLFILLTLIAVFCFIKSLHDGKKLHWALYTIAVLSVLYTHNFGVFVALFLNAYFLILFRTYRNRIKSWLFVNALVSLIYLPWLVIMLGGFTKVDWIPQTRLSSVFLLALQFATGEFFYQTYFSGRDINPYYAEISVTSVFILLFALGLNNYKSRKTQILLLGIWFFLPIILTYLISLFTIPIFYSRFLVFTSIPYYILAANGLVKIRPKFIQFVLLAAFIYYTLLNLGSTWIERDGHYKVAFSYLKKNIKSDQSLLVVSGARLQHVFFYYYPERYNRFLDIDSTQIGDLKNIVNNDRKYPQGRNDLWLFCFNLSKTELSSLLAVMGDEYGLKDKESFIGENICPIVLLHFIKGAK